MSRIRPLDPEQIDPELRERVEVQERSTPVLPRIAGYLPEVGKHQQRLAAAIERDGDLPPKLRELMRLRIAFHNQCRTCMSIRYAPALEDGLTEQLVCCLEHPEQPSDLTDAERAAVRFADLFASDHLAIDDALVDELRQSFSEKQIVAMSYWCAFAVGFGRMVAVWDVGEGLSPTIERQTGVVTPWVNGASEDDFIVLGT
jgi:AhpD family alkylhydroperoxidase